MAIISLFNLPDADTLSGSEIFPVSQNGTTKRTAISAIGGGIGSVTSGQQASVLAGLNNKSLSSFGVIAQGNNNCINSGQYNSILNGKDNCNLSHCHSTILGGQDNFIVSIADGDTEFSVINGRSNCLSGGKYSIIGGSFNIINSTSNYGNTILNGSSSYIWKTNIPTSTNTILNGSAFIYNGGHNVIGSGSLNITCHTNNGVVGSGTLNCIFSAHNGFIGNGIQNKICIGTLNSIVNGQNNTIATGSRSSILGGNCNSLSGSDSFIIGSCLTANANCTTFVNNLSSQCSLHAGNGFTGTVSISSTAGDKSLVITDGIITGLS
jgi:hypothetical protein|tara:strand:- start:1194 stop:2162 length:969 start_codon:yes stop_codon:yes gene_type:complete